VVQICANAIAIKARRACTFARLPKTCLIQIEHFHIPKLRFACQKIAKTTEKG
jgi:hypothetical protein